MTDPQDVRQKTRYPGWQSLLVSTFVLVFFSGMLDYSVFHLYGFSEMDVVLLLGQIMVHSVFALLTYLRQYRTISTIARISGVLWLIGVVMYWYCFPETVVLKWDEVERMLNITFVMVALWSSLVVVFAWPQMKNRQEEN